MDLMYRPGMDTDIEFCLNIVAQQLAHSGEDMETLRNAWLKLMKRQEMWFAVLEDHARKSRPAVGFGMRVFLSGEFADFLKRGTRAYAGLLVADWERRSRTPALNTGAIRQANQSREGGLVMLIMHHGWPLQTPLNIWQIRDRLLDSLTVGHRGYHLAEVLIECYGATELRNAHTAGFKTRTDYAPYFSSRQLPDAEQHPYLLGITRAEAQQETSRISSAFQHTPPRFFFEERQQTLLRYALGYATNKQIAEALPEWNYNKTKNTWNKIYTVVQESAPDFFGDIEITTEERGLEKRRYLLGYLQRHREELLPALHFCSAEEAQARRKQAFYHEQEQD